MFIRGNQEKLRIAERYSPYIQRLANVDHLETGPDLKRPDESAASVVQDLELFVPLSGLIDITKEKELPLSTL